VRSIILIHYIYKVGGWQPSAASGWFTLLIRVYPYKRVIGVVLGYTPYSRSIESVIT
jgi:hypothetical protein